MSLPTFEFPDSGGPTTMIQRMAWYLNRGVIEKVWYPVFPPDKNAATVLAWLQTRDDVAPLSIRPKTDGDAEYVRAELHKHWHCSAIWSLGNVFDAENLPALIAWQGTRRVGLLTYAIHIGGRQMEVVTLSSSTESIGAGTRLLAYAAELARATGCLRIFLTTTNDNLHAIGFYQRRGWTLARYHSGSMDRARTIKPAIPRIGLNNIPLKDELEYELRLEVNRD